MSESKNAALRDLFDRALATPEGQRATLLDRECGSDADLRRRIQTMLEVAESNHPFLREPNPSVVSAATFVHQAHETPGTTIGRYKLLQMIGEGGFGVVYLAEQREPVQRRVALKIIKLGMDTRQVIARFEAEQQALAMMDHPNIARVFDAGATDTGRPYFVMELVRGDPITAYCDTNNLSTEQRLELFQQVCNAVQHAHQKGIIHRDIKPSNVLVTIADGRPIPKVIDFGIAKATSARLTEKTLFTEHRALIGTPEYMSPEQAEMTGVDIDTRSDIYSLGVLLYELLTGTTPFDSHELRSAAFGEIQRIIREVEPQKPSTRLSTMGEGLPSVAAHRHSEPARLTKSVRGDLDWIVMKCLEKDRTRRYETANALALDLQRHLDGDPVVAAPPSMPYRLNKFVRRNRRAVVAAGLVAAALMLGMFGTTAGMLKAQDETKRADREAAAAKRQMAIAESVNKLITDMLAKANRLEQKGNPNVTVREVMETLARDLESGAAAYQPEIEAAVRLSIGTTYKELSLLSEAEPHLRKALEIRKRLFGDNHRSVAEALAALADWHRRAAHFDDAMSCAEQALAIRRDLLDQKPELVQALRDLGSIHYWKANYAQADQFLLEALALRREIVGPKHTDVAELLLELANVASTRGDHAEAEARIAEARGMRRELLGEKHPDVANVDLMEGKMFLDRAMFEAALEPLRRAVNIYRQAEDTSVVYALGKLGYAFHGLGEQSETERITREQLQEARRLFGEQHPETAIAMHNLGLTLSSAGSIAEGNELRRQAVAISRRTQGDRHPATVNLAMVEATYLANQIQFTEALPLYREFVPVLRQLNGERNSEVLRRTKEYLAMLRRAGGGPETETIHQDLLRLHRDFGPLRNLADAQAYYVLGEILLGFLERASEGEQCLRAALPILREHREAAPLDYACCVAMLGAALAKRGQFLEAEALLRESVPLLRALKNEEDELSNALRNLGVVLANQGRLEEGLEAVREVVALTRRWPGAPASGDFLLPQYLQQERNILNAMSRHAEAEPVAREILDIQRQHLAPGDPEFEDSLLGLYNCLMPLGRAAEAEPIARELVENVRLRHDGRSQTLALYLLALARTLGDLGKFEEAIAAAREGVVVARACLAQGARPADFEILELVGWNLSGDRPVEGEEFLAAALEFNREQFGDNHLTTLLNAARLGMVRVRAQRSGAVASLNDTLARLRDAADPRSHDMLVVAHNAMEHLKDAEHVDDAGPAADLLHMLLVGGADTGDPAANASVRANLAYTLLLLQRYGDAESLARTALELRTELFPDDHADAWLKYNAMSLLGGALAGQGKFAEAEPLLLDAYNGMKDDPNVPAPTPTIDRKREALDRIVKLYEAWPKPDEAATWRALLNSPEAAKPAPQDPSQAKP